MEEEAVPAAKICLEEAVVMPVTVRESDLFKRVTSFVEGNCETGQTACRRHGGSNNTQPHFLRDRNNNVYQQQVISKLPKC